MESSLTRDEALSELIRRIEAHFGDRLVQLVELDDLPFEHIDENGIVLAVVVHEDGEDHWRDVWNVARIEADFGVDTAFPHTIRIRVESVHDLDAGRTYLGPQIRNADDLR